MPHISTGSLDYWAYRYASVVQAFVSIFKGFIEWDAVSRIAIKKRSGGRGGGGF